MDNVLRNIHYVFGGELFQFRARTKSPGYSAGLYATVVCRLHVYSRVTYIKGFFLAYSGLFYYVIYNSRIGFYVDTLPLSQYGNKRNVWKEITDKLFCGALVFVGGNSQHLPLLMQLV